MASRDTNSRKYGSDSSLTNAGSRIFHIWASRSSTSAPAVVALDSNSAPSIEDDDRFADRLGIEFRAKVAFLDGLTRARRHLVEPALICARGRVVEFTERAHQMGSASGDPVGAEHVRDHERAVNHAFERRRGRLGDAAEGLIEVRTGFLDDGGGQRLLRVEVIVERTLGHLGALDDVAQSGSRVTDLVEEVDGRGNDLPAGRLGSCLAHHVRVPPKALPAHRRGDDRHHKSFAFQRYRLLDRYRRAPLDELGEVVDALGRGDSGQDECPHLFQVTQKPLGVSQIARLP